MTSRRRATSNQRWNIVVHVNVEIYNVEQRRINVVYFNVDINNVWQRRRNNVVIFNVEFHDVDQRRKNVVNMTICKMLKRVKKKEIWNQTCWTPGLYYYFKILLTLFPILTLFRMGIFTHILQRSNLAQL